MPKLNARLTYQVPTAFFKEVNEDNYSASYRLVAAS